MRISISTSSGKLEQRKLAQLQFLLSLAFPSREAAISPPVFFARFYIPFIFVF